MRRMFRVGGLPLAIAIERTNVTKKQTTAIGGAMGRGDFPLSFSCGLFSHETMLQTLPPRLLLRIRVGDSFSMSIGNVSHIPLTERELKT